MRVLLSVPMIPYTGYGRDGIAIIDLFLDAGADIHLDPDCIAPPVSPRIAALLTKQPVKSFDVQIKQFDPARLRSSQSERDNARILHGWTMWEWTHLDARLHPETIAKVPFNLEFFHSIAVYDRVSEKAVAPWCPPGVFEFRAQGGYDPNDAPFCQRDWSGRPFRFVMYGALTPRKGPFYAIEAFNELRARRPDLDVELHLKTTEVGLHPALEQNVPGLRIYNEVWPLAKLHQFMRSTHCLLCPSLGEGKNAAALEYAASGGAVIASDWGGHTVWLTPDIAWPLRCETVLEAPTRKAQRAEPDVKHLSELMEQVIEDREDTQRRTQNAVRQIPQMFSWRATTTRMFEFMANDQYFEQKLVAQEVVQMLRAMGSS